MRVKEHEEAEAFRRAAHRPPEPEIGAEAAEAAEAAEVEAGGHVEDAQPQRTAEEEDALRRERVIQELLEAEEAEAREREAKKRAKAAQAREKRTKAAFRATRDRQARKTAEDSVRRAAADEARRLEEECRALERAQQEVPVAARVAQLKEEEELEALLAALMPGDSCEVECVVCMERAPEVRNMPCGHVVMCQLCAAAVLQSSKGCPMCRSDFVIEIV